MHISVAISVQAEPHDRFKGIPLSTDQVLESRSFIVRTKSLHVMADDDDKIPDYEMTVQEQTWEGHDGNIQIRIARGKQSGRDASGAATSTSWKFVECRETSLLHASPSSESDAASSPLADWDEGPDEYDKYSMDPDEARFGPDEGDARHYGKDEGPDEYGIDRMKERHQRQDDAYNA